MKKKTEKKEDLDCIYIYKKICNINLGSYRLRLERRIFFDTVNKIWRKG